MMKVSVNCFIILVLIVLAIIALLGFNKTFSSNDKAVVNRNVPPANYEGPKPPPVPPISKNPGQYTVIQYQPEWQNVIYIQDYNLSGQVLYIKEKGSSTFKPIPFSNVYIANGWIEGEELEKYGHFIFIPEGEKFK